MLAAPFYPCITNAAIDSARIDKVDRIGFTTALAASGSSGSMLVPPSFPRRGAKTCKSQRMIYAVRSINSCQRWA